MTNLLFLLVLYLPFQIALNPTAGIDLASIRIAILALFFIWLADSLRKKRLVIKNNLHTSLVVIFLFLNLFSIFFARNTDWSVRKLLFLFSIFPIYFVTSAIVNSQDKMEKISKGLIISGLLVAMLGIFQFSLQFLIGLDASLALWQNIIAPFLGKSFFQAVLEYPSWLVNISGATYFRAISIFPDPHMFSLYLGMLFPLGLALFLTSRKNIWLIASIFILTANLLTFSRGAYLGLSAGLLFFLFLGWKKVGKKYKIGALIFTGLMLITFLIPNPISSRFFSIFNTHEGSNSERLAIWKETAKIIAERPIIGTGIGNFSLAVKPLADYREPIYAHNTYLDIAAETGIFSALIWIGILVISIITFLKNAKKNIPYPGDAFSLVIFSAHSLVETGLYSPVVLALLLIIIAFANVESQELKTNSAA